MPALSSAMNVGSDMGHRRGLSSTVLVVVSSSAISAAVRVALDDTEEANAAGGVGTRPRWGGRKASTAAAQIPSAAAAINGHGDMDDVCLVLILTC